MCIFVGSLHSFNSILVKNSDQIADVEFYQTNQAMALKMLNLQELVLLVWNVCSASYANSDN